jgi:hypothetical protein
VVTGTPFEIGILDSKAASVILYTQVTRYRTMRGWKCISSQESVSLFIPLHSHYLCSQSVGFFRHQHHDATAQSIHRARILERDSINHDK